MTSEGEAKPEERWLTVPPWPHYEASSLGRVRTVAGRILSQRDCTGYLGVTLFTSGDGTRRTGLVHRLVAMAFLGMPDDSTLSVNHKDGTRKNNVPENLEYGTQGENIRHAIHTLKRPGHKFQLRETATLSDAQVLEIRGLATEGRSQRSIGQKFGVSQQHVSKLVRGVRRGYVGATDREARA